MIDNIHQMIIFAIQFKFRESIFYLFYKMDQVNKAHTALNIIEKSYK